MDTNFYNNSQFKKILELFGIFKDPIIGFDIGSSAVKIMEVDRQGDDYYIKNFAIEKLNIGDVVEKNIKNKEAVISALNKALAKTKISSKLGCISVPNSTTIYKILQLEHGLDESEIFNEIELESDRYIPYDLEDVNLDFEILGPSKIRNNLMDVILVATKKENVKLRSNILEEIGIKPHIIDVESLSIERVFNMIISKDLPDNGNGKLIGLFDIGSTSTSLNVFHDLRLVYSKEQAFGGQQLLDELQKRYGLTLQEAILARKYNDLPDDYVVDVLDPYRNKIVQQIIRSSQIFFSSIEYTKFDYICLTGGTSNLPGIENAISEALKLKVITVNPIKHFHVAEHIPSDTLAEESLGLINCCGLALRNLTRKS